MKTLLLLTLSTFALTFNIQADDFTGGHDYSCQKDDPCQDCQGPRGPRGHRGHHGEDGATGATGATGLTGATGTGALSSFYTYNDSGLLTLTVAAGDAIPFNQAGVDVGSSVLHNPVGAPADFVLVEEGTYLVTFVGSSALASLLGGVQFEVDGVPVGATSTLISAGAPVVLQGLIQVADAPVTLNVVVNGLAVTFGSGTSAQISITRVNPGI